MTKLIILFNAVLLSIFTFFSPKEKTKTISDSAMPMCSSMPESSINKWQSSVATEFKSVKANAVNFQTDSTKSYSMPLLATTNKGDVILSWTEKDLQGITSFCFSVSKDNGKSFSDKKVIYAGSGISNGRLMRAKVLTKKDGSLVAVFSNRADAPAAGNQQGGGRGRGGRSSDIVYSESRDNGNTWSKPQSVDADPTKGIVRGFFDAVVLPNDEVAVAYLKDVANSTKQEERNLRLVITKNGAFQPERVIDPVVCDCCNINMLIDAQGALNVYYRDNNDDIRDFARMTSTDNGATFSKPQIIYNDGWKIEGCPHNGAISSVFGKTALVAWYSGAEKESGVKLATQEGKKLLVLTDESVKNPCLTSSQNMAVMMWEQNTTNTDKKQLVFTKISGDKVSENISVDGSINATNATALILGDRLLIANEVKEENKKNSLKISVVSL